MNRMIHLIELLLVLLHVLSLICGCSRDAGQSETTDAGQSGTPVPTAEEKMTGTKNAPSVIYTPYDFRSPSEMFRLYSSFKIDTPVEHDHAEDYQLVHVTVDQEKLDAFAASVGMPELADLDAFRDLFSAFSALSAPDLGADLIEGMIWDPNADTLTFVYQTLQDDGLTEYARLLHDRRADADAIQAKLDADGTVTPLFLNETADAVYLHRDDAEALCVTVIWNEQVMHLTMFGDDAELRMAQLEDADFSVTASTLLGDPYTHNLWAPGQYAHKKSEYRSMTVISRLFEAQDDANSDIIQLLSPIRVPMIDGMEPSVYLVCTEPDVRTVECQFTAGGNTTATVAYDFCDTNAMDAVTRLYRSRCTDGDWLSIDDNRFCTIIDGIYVTASCTEFADFTVEDLTFGETVAERINIMNNE